MRRDPNPEQPERIAFATSEPTDGRSPARWTELAVYYLHRPKKYGRCWCAVVRGCSTHPGEDTRHEEITVGTLERALKLFDPNTSLGRSVTAQAEDWEAEHLREARVGAGARVTGQVQSTAGSRAPKPPNELLVLDEFTRSAHDAIRLSLSDGRPSMMGEVTLNLQPPLGDDASQDEALRWLYGDELDRAKPQTLLARDFGVKESTARMQISAGRPIMIPLTKALRFFNRPAFEKARSES